MLNNTVFYWYYIKVFFHFLLYRFMFVWIVFQILKKDHKNPFYSHFWIEAELFGNVALYKNFIFIDLINLFRGFSLLLHVIKQLHFHL